MCRSALLRFSRLADENVRSARPRHRSPHQQQVFVGVHLHDLQIFRRHLLVSHVTRKVLVLPHARRKRTAADAARCAMMHRTVRLVAAGVVPALHAALKTLALAHAAHVHEFAGLEVFHQHPVAHLGLVLRFPFGLSDAHFLQHLHGRHAGLLEVPGHGLVHALRLDKFHEPQLRGLVAVFILRAPRHHTHGPAWSTVHPASVPSSRKICVIPSLMPMIPLTAIASSLSASLLIRTSLQLRSYHLLVSSVFGVQSSVIGKKSERGSGRNRSPFSLLTYN